MFASCGRTNRHPQGPVGTSLTPRVATSRWAPLWSPGSTHAVGGVPPASAVLLLRGVREI